MKSFLIVLLGLFMIPSAGWDGIGSYLARWIGQMQDPTERGLAYIAVAVVIHALVSDAGKVQVSHNDVGSK